MKDPSQPIEGSTPMPGNEELEGEEQRQDEPALTDKESCCEDLFYFKGVKSAQGSALTWFGHGGIIMSNVFLSSSLTFLANQEAGCIDESSGEIIDDCDGRVYGFAPSNVVANIAVIGGMIIAVTLPMVGAIIDYTDQRRMVGVYTMLFLVSIQAAQIGTVANTWFIMAILQAIAAALFEMQSAVNYAYVIEMREMVPPLTQARFLHKFQGIIFTSELSFIILVTAISTLLDFDDVQTGQLGQGVNVAWSGFTMLYAFARMFPNVPRKRPLPEGASLFTEGFRQTWRTAVNINKHYKKGLRYFIVASAFAEGGADALVILAIIFLEDFLKLDTTEVGIFFAITIIGLIVGCRLGLEVAKRSNPNTSIKLDLVFMAVMLMIGAFTLNENSPGVGVYGWGFGLGLSMGWFYPASNLWFTSAIPSGQENELSGFYVCSKTILIWASPLVFSALVEADIPQNYAILNICGFLLIAFLILSFCSPWEEILEEAGKKIEEETTDLGENENVSDAEE